MAVTAEVFGPPVSGAGVTSVGSGLTLTGGVLTNDLLTGVAGGQTVTGGTGAADNLDLRSTSNGTKGFTRIGGSTGFVYDETNKRVGLNNASPDSRIQVGSTLGAATLFGSSDSTISIQSGAGTYPSMLFGVSSVARGRLSFDDSTGVQLSTNIGTLWLFAPSNSELNLTNTQFQVKPGGTLVLHATSAGVFGATAASGNLTLGSTTNATKGSIYFGSSAGLNYDETNKRLGIGGVPATTLTLFAASGGTTWLQSQVSGANAVGRFQINTTVGDWEMRANRSLATELGVASTFAVLVSTGTSGPTGIGTSGAADMFFATNSAETFRIDNATNRLKFASTSITANGSGAVTAPGSIGPSAISVQEWLTVKNASGTTRYVPLYG